jgi:hypothetical protein
MISDLLRKSYCLWYGFMWEKILRPDRPQMTIWRMRSSCCIPKATNTYSEYVILIAFPLQTMLAQTRLKFTLYVNGLSCFSVPVYVFRLPSILFAPCNPVTLFTSINYVSFRLIFEPRSRVFSFFLTPVQYCVLLFYRAIKKSLCIWWFQYRKLQVKLEVSPASLQT